MPDTELARRNSDAVYSGFNERVSLASMRPVTRTIALPVTGWRGLEAA